ncbi:hypothetical protein HIO71_03880 [Chryseobacterium aquaticum]|uniref:Uncharacterized protein n=1 Tax=Chryseobacterium aquaticum TaxID=452084 RepID=A0A848N7L9_9FLAO|nr:MULTISPECIES: hypothetical protein [Chryseobacterium]NMR33343.1 hypothetical protein [Chryseobacterium aquaticum]NRQ44726.1 hypothetical protein [Chryseobacterium sp. C-204]
MIKEDLENIFDGFENLSKSDKLIVNQEFVEFIKQRKAWLETLTDDNILRTLR